MRRAAAPSEHNTIFLIFTDSRCLTAEQHSRQISQGSGPPHPRSRLTVYIFPRWSLDILLICKISVLWWFKPIFVKIVTPTNNKRNLILSMSTNVFKAQNLDLINEYSLSRSDLLGRQGCWWQCLVAICWSDELWVNLVYIVSQSQVVSGCPHYCRLRGLGLSAGPLQARIYCDTDQHSYPVSPPLTSYTHPLHQDL